MRKIREIYKEYELRIGIGLACVTFVSVFGLFVHEAWEQDRINDARVVELAEVKQELQESLEDGKEKQETIISLSEQVDGLKLDVEGLMKSVDKLKQDRTIYLDGKIYFARSTFDATATAYTKRDEEGTADGITYTETQVTEGRTIAVDPNEIPLGSIVYIESNSPYVGGFYVAEDIGGAIDGHKIDIYMEDIARAFKFGRQQIKVTILQEVSL